MATDKYTTAQIIEALRKARGLITLSAQALGCEPQTIRNYVKRYPTVAEALKEERERMTDIAEAALYTRVKEGDAWAVCFYLKTQGKDRGYVERAQVEQSGRDGGPIETTNSKLEQAARELTEWREQMTKQLSGQSAPPIPPTPATPTE